MRLTVEVRCERKILMKLAAFVFLSTVACAMAQSASLHSSELKFGDLGISNWKTVRSFGTAASPITHWGN